jgi:hypothetical protein
MFPTVWMPRRSFLPCRAPRRAGPALLVLLACAPTPAVAQTTAPAPGPGADEVQDRRAAAEAYDNGTSHYLRRDFATAANWFEAADRLAPSPLALQSAIRAHREAGGGDHFARAATLALRLQARYPDNARAVQVATRTLQALGSRLVRVTVRCQGCDVEVDSVLQATPDFFVTPGRHTLLAHWSEGRTREQTIEAAAGSTETVALEAPPLPERAPPPATPSPMPTPTPAPILVPPPSQRDVAPAPGISPVVFAGGVAATAVLGGLTLASWLDALDGGRQLLQNAERTHTRDVMREQAVQSAEDRTTALLVATGVVGAATVVTGVFFTRWGGRTRVALAPATDGRGSVGLSLGGRF